MIEPLAGRETGRAPAEENGTRPLEVGDLLARLQEAERRLAAFAESGVIGLIVGEELGVTEANDAFLEMLGLDRSAIDAGQVDVESITPPEWRSFSRVGHDELRQTGRMSPIRKEYQATDGRRVPVLVGGARISVDPLRWICFVRDLRPERAAQEALAETAARLDALMRAAPVGLAIVDRDLVVRSVNDQLVELLGREEAPPSGRPLGDVWPDLACRLEAPLRAALGTGERVLDLPFDVAGTERHVVASCFPVEVEGRPVAAGLSLVDVTEERQLLSREHAARAEAEQARQRVEALQEVTDAALSTLSLDELLDALMHRVRAVLGVDTVRILLLDPSGTTLSQGGAVGLDGAVASDSVPVGKGFSGRVAATRQPLVIDDLPSYPVHSVVLRNRGLASVAGVPMLSGGRLIGVMHVGSESPRHFGDGDVQLLTLAAERIAVAIDRARAFEREQRARERSEFLAAVNDALTGTLEQEELVDTVVQAAVPRLGDWASIHAVAGDGGPPSVHLAHADPARRAWAREFITQFQWDPDAAGGVAEVLRTGRPILYAEIPVERLDEAIAADPRLEPLRTLGVTSILIVPLRARHRVIGAMQLVRAESGGRYTPDDVTLAEDIAARIAAALDNARLYGEQRALAHTLQRSLLPEALPEVPGLEIAAFYRPMSGGEVGGDFYDVKPLPDGTWTVMIGDVSGKGVSAAATTALARHTLGAVVADEGSPAKVLRHLHDELLWRRSVHYCTAVLARTVPDDLGTGTEQGVGAGPAGGARLRFASAGHPLPILVRPGRAAVTVGRYGTPLGLVDDVRVTESEVLVGPGDTLVLYTDGATDLPPPAALGEDDLLVMVEEAAQGASAQEVVDRLAVALQWHQRGASHLDDLALLVLRGE